MEIIYYFIGFGGVFSSFVFYSILLRQVCAVHASVYVWPKKCTIQGKISFLNIDEACSIQFYHFLSQVSFSFYNIHCNQISKNSRPFMVRICFFFIRIALASEWSRAMRWEQDIQIHKCKNMNTMRKILKPNTYFEYFFFFVKSEIILLWNMPEWNHKKYTRSHRAMTKWNDVRKYFTKNMQTSNRKQKCWNFLFSHLQFCVYVYSNLFEWFGSLNLLIK